MSGERHCDVELEAPSLCAWARSADAVVFARIDVLDLVVEGAVADDGRDGWRVFPECRSANPALVIGLSVDRVLSGEAPDRIALVVGAEQVSRFNPLPLRASDDGLVWTRSSDPLTGPLTVGAHMVVPAHRLDNSWSLKGDVLLGVDSEGRVHLPQRTGDCLNTLPPEIGGLAVNDLGGLLSQCSEIEPMLAERRDLRESLWGRGQMPSFSLSAKCTDPLDNVAEKTVTDRSRPDNTAVEHSEERR